MRSLLPVTGARAPYAPLLLSCAVALAASTAMSCSNEALQPTDPLSAPAAASVRGQGGKAITVSTSAELAAALVPGHAGHRIRLRAGTYDVMGPLVVPDGATLEGEGVMLFDGDGRPTGFAPDTRTTLRMAGTAPGDMLTLGDGVTIRNLQIADRAGRAGNVVAVLSRDAGDRVAATIIESEIVNPNPSGPGPRGQGLFVVTRNANPGPNPLPHEGAELTVHMARSVIRSPAGPAGVFAFNFAPRGKVFLTLASDVVGGGVNANGGVSGPQPVHEAEVTIASRHGLYRDDTSNPCATPRLGWNLTGGSGPAIPGPAPATARNTLRMHSIDDRIEGFAVGIVATGARRFFAAAGPSTDNALELQLIGTTIATSACGGAPFATDLRMAGALVTDASLVPGEGNTLRAVIRGVTGSGARSNSYADVLGPAGPMASGLEGTGNRLVIAGNLKAFLQTNRGLHPVPGSVFFSSAAR